MFNARSNTLRGCRIDVPNRRIYTSRTERTDKSLKFYSTDELKRLTEALDRFKIPYLIGNDAPKGGKKGNYLTFRNVDFFNLIENETSNKKDSYQ